MNWTSSGKTIAHLIRELQSFEDQSMEVRISVDGGGTSYPISLVAKAGGRYALLKNSEGNLSVIDHRVGVK